LPITILSRAGMHTSLFYVALFMMTGAHLPFWPIWLAEWGLSAAEVGLYTALGMAVRVVAGLALPALADRLDARRHTVAALALIGAVLFVAHLGVATRPLLFLLTLASGAAMAGIMPIGEALGVAAARSSAFAYAQARAMGSAGFLGASLMVGVLTPVLGTGLVLWWVVGCLVALAWLARDHPGGGKVKGQIPPSLREIGGLVVDPLFALFIATVAFTQASHAVLYALGSVHWRELGLGEGRIGALWAVGVAVEIVVLFTFGSTLVGRLGPVRSIALAAGAGVVRWGGMMADPTGPLLWPLQALHAVTFGVAHLGAMAFIGQAVPPRFGAAAQGAMSAMAVGLLMALAMAVAAAIYPSAGGLTYGISAGLSALGLALSAVLARRWRGQSVAT
jgi:MFS transporter, PPP family, 3-phenylpropionic acid transporter